MNGLSSSKTHVLDIRYENYENRKENVLNKLQHEFH